MSEKRYCEECGIELVRNTRRCPMCMDYKLKNFERETIINYNDETKIADIYTCNAAMIRKMDEKVEKYPEHFWLVREDSCSKTYQCEKKLVSIRNPVILSEEKKKALADRLREARRNRF